MSSVPTDQTTALAWPGLRAFGAHHAEEEDASLELALRSEALQFGYWLGWASIVVVSVGLALDAGTPHRWLLVGATVAAAAGNTLVMTIPWRAWLGTRRGRALLDLWCGGLIAFVALLVVGAGSSFALLLFLVVPFIAVVQVGWRRGLWLVVTAATCAAVAALIPLSAGATAMRLGLVAAAAVIALVLARTIGREAAAHQRAAARADLERTLAREANHRIKNDLQTAADLLLLGRPDGSDGAVFDETAARLRSIATVHRLLTETEDRIDGGTLIRSITAGLPVPVAVEADQLALDAATAQKVGIIANELVTNAVRHGALPIVVRLERGTELRLRIDDSGTCDERAAGFGLGLVRQIAEHGLTGSFELRSLDGGGTRAEVVFPTVPQ